MLVPPLSLQCHNDKSSYELYSPGPAVASHIFPDFLTMLGVYVLYANFLSSVGNSGAGIYSLGDSAPACIPRIVSVA